MKDAILAELKKSLPEFFSIKKSLFHYWHMAETHYREYLKDEKIRLKKYFYALRPLLAAKWIKGAKVQVLNEYIERALPEIKSIAEGQEDTSGSWDLLNTLFLSMVQR
ncbi:DNA polymerase beta superfamily protein [Fusibacillus kribbianus]|uniref:Nucleotidyltransferase domain-containing protein n=1 Tax=Fusibacillus kribbianus TaxID=3044208 RepID=A0AAP4EWP0_9FIRM|nr:nucleotidyltransferase domain-containing protein [Ruminococcus sp. YH-rum2234]MDI9240912.1 nucleotidyltransferase domain-containing protein [Ruminococcus sp. YH-rum2234]